MMLRGFVVLAVLMAAPSFAEEEREIWLRGDGDLVYIQEEGKVVLDRDGRKGFTKVARSKWPTVSAEARRVEAIRNGTAPRRTSTGVILYDHGPRYWRGAYRYGPPTYRSYRYARPYRYYRHGYHGHGHGHYRHGHRGHHRVHRGTLHGRPRFSRHHRGSHFRHRGFRSGGRSFRGDVGRRGYSREMLGHRGRR